MIEKTFELYKSLENYEDKLKAIRVLSVLLLPEWKTFLMTPVSDLVDDMIECGTLPIAIADAFDDFGQFCQRLGNDIMQERMRRGLPIPAGPDD